MIIETQIDYGDIRKALEVQQQAHAAAPSPTAGGSSAQPQGGPRPGHKYVKRWWDGGKWQYEYPGEGSVQQAHHPLEHGAEDTHQVPHPDPARAQRGETAHVPKREHTLALPEGHSYGPGQEEQAYKDTLGAAFKPGSQHVIPSPDGNGNMQVVVGDTGRIFPRSADGKPLMKKKDGKAFFWANPAQYEDWYRGIKAGPVTLSDPHGKPWVKIEPVMGKVDRASGMLNPNKDPNRRWKVVLADDVDPAMVPPEWQNKAQNIADTADKMGAYKAADQMRQVMEQRLGKPFGWQAPAGGAPGAAAPAQATMQQQVAAPAQQAGAPAAAPQQMAPGGVEKPQQGMDHPDPLVRQLSQIGWKKEEGIDGKTHRPAMVRKFAGTPQQKEQLVQELATKYSPVIFNTVKQMMARDPNLATPYWQERLTGGVQMGENTPIIPSEGSHIHSALSRMIDNYDPAKTGADGRPLGLDAYVAGSLPQDMLRVLEGQRDEVYGGAGKPSGNVSVRPKESTAATMASRLGMGSGGEGENARGGGITDETGETPEESVNRINDWKTRQSEQLDHLAETNPKAAPFVQQAKAAVSKVQNDDHLDKFAEVMHRFGYGEHMLDKSLHKALWLMKQEEIRKAAANGKPMFLSPDKKVDPTHTYAHKEGDDDHPRFFYKDPQNNFVRYTNAPSGHTDNSSFHGEAAPHPSEPLFNAAPQYFDPQGRKLTRAPEPGAEVQWNPNYHPNDPENLWVGRWVDPFTGQHAHTYVDSDMRMMPKMYLHQQIQLVDVRLPILRKYIRSLFSSAMLKDKIVATALALVDQARFRIEEIGHLRVKDVQFYGSIFDIGGHLVFGDHKFRTMMSLLIKNRAPQEPLFAVPMTKKDGKADPQVVRRIGPHFLQSLLENMGITPTGLLAYHATETFSREVERLLTENDAPWESAMEYATIAVAQEMGHDLSQEQNVGEVLPLIRESMVDPVVVEVLEQNAKDAGMVGEMQMTLPIPPPHVAFVTFDLMQRTQDEAVFSKWLHTYPAHLHAEPLRPNLMNAPNMPNAESPVQEMNPLAQQSPGQEMQAQQRSQEAFA